MKNFVRWSAQALPGGDRINSLPILSLEEYVKYSFKEF